jgi:hypothetical protein
MSLPKPITISEEAALIEAALQPLVTSYGGTAAVVSNLRDLWNQSSMDSQVPRILVCYNGETARGTFSQVSPWHRVDRNWTIAVTKGRGFYAARGAGLFDGTATEPPLYDVVETIREIIRGMQNISEETPGPDYRGIKPMQMGNIVVDGYTIEVTTANDIPSNLTIKKP